MEQATMSALAFVLSCVSLLLAAIAYWRTGGREDVRAVRDELQKELAALRERQRSLTEQLSETIRNGYEESLVRIRRTQARLTDARKEAGAEVAARIDAVARSLSELSKRAEDGLARLGEEAGSEVQAAERTLARSVERLEAEAQILVVRTEMTRAERLAKRGELEEAERLLEDAVSRTYAIRNVIPGGSAEARALDEVNDALIEAIRRVREKADGFRREIDRVVKASEALIASLETLERKAA